MNREDFERRVLTDDREDLGVAGVGSDPVEEHADLELPPLQVGTQHRNLLLIGQLSTAKCLGASADPQLACPSGPQVAHPLAFAARRYQVAAPLMGEQVHRRCTPLAAGSSPDRQDPRADDAYSVSSQERDGSVEDVAGEPS